MLMRITRRAFTSASLAVAAFYCAVPAARAQEPLRIGGTGAALGLLRRIAEAFGRQGEVPPVEIISGLGSAGSIAAVAGGAIDLAVSGRDLNAREQGAGLVSSSFIETPFIFVSMTPMALSLTRAEIIRIYSGELFTLPNGETARLILRPRSEAAMLYLGEAIKGIAEAVEQARLRPDVPVAATDQENLVLVSRVPNAVTGMTLTQFLTEPNALKRIELDGVTPDLAAMRSGAYPLRQRMTLVHRPQIAPPLAMLLAFMRGDIATDVLEKAGAGRLRDSPRS
jgi:phosphate transport system substrate-binding protein